MEVFGKGYMGVHWTILMTFLVFPKYALKIIKMSGLFEERVELRVGEKKVQA